MTLRLYHTIQSNASKNLVKVNCIFNSVGGFGVVRLARVANYSSVHYKMQQLESKGVRGSSEESTENGSVCAVKIISK